jgi:hypothetical protein
MNRNVTQSPIPHRYNSASVNFIRVELDVAIALCHDAECADSCDSAKLSIANARAAYNAAIKFMPRVQLTSGERSEFDEKRLQLDSLFEQLGEVLKSL